MSDTILDAIAILIPIIIGLFGAGWGVKAWAKKIAAGAIEGKKYLKEVDDILTAAAEDLADGDVSTDDLKRLFKEGKDLFSVIKGVNKVVKK